MVPLLAQPLQAVNVDCRGHTEQARQQGEASIRAVAVEQHVAAMSQDMQRRKKGMGDGVEILVAQGRQVYQLDPVIHR